MGETDQEAEPAVDDTSADAAQVEDRAATASTFDDIAPPDTTVVIEPAVDSPSQAEVQSWSRRVPAWPFLLYVVVWLTLAGVVVWQLLAMPTSQVVYESNMYRWMTLGGTLMTAVGPLLALVVWYAVWWDAEPRQRAGLFSAALIRGALATFCGVVVWWGAIMIVDMFRLGRSF